MPSFAALAFTCGQKANTRPTMINGIAIKRNVRNFILFECFLNEEKDEYGNKEKGQHTCQRPIAYG
jgi:hypothetical protein